jgi:hypothetical protein
MKVVAQFSAVRKGALDRASIDSYAGGSCPRPTSV